LHDISSKTIVTVTIAILVVIMIASNYLYSSEFQNPKIVFKEEPIHKNKELQLKNGEQYQYTYVVNSTEVNITYIVTKSTNCTNIRLKEVVEDSDICLDKWGVDQSGYNATLLNPTVLMFRPWMLALDNNWKWNTSTYMMLGNELNYLGSTRYRVVRTEEYNGRESFVVEISTNVGMPEYQWVDVEKRILLRTIGPTYEILFVNGPIKLQNN